MSVYFGDLWIDDLAGLEYGLQEMVRPVYGYASRTWDVFARGTRIVVGTFRLAFKEAGYLYRALDHIGQLQGIVKPALAYMAGGEPVPKWHADVKERMEDAVARWHGDSTAQAIPVSPASTGQAGSTVTIVIQPSEYEMVSKEDRSIMPARRLGEKMKTTVSWNAGEAVIGGKPFKPYKVENGTAWVYVRFVLEAHGYFVHWDKNTKVITATKRVESTLPPSPVVTAPTAGAIAPAPGQTSSLEKSLAAYEAEVWGRRFSPNAEAFRKYNPHFYTGQHMASLREHGFDIHIVFGPLPDDIRLRNNQMPDTVSYNTTVKALRNVQLVRVEQLLDANGRPIEELYGFMAQDID